MRLTCIFVIFLCQTVHSYTLYECKNPDGTKAYQDKPCKGETIKVTEPKDSFDNSKFKQEMIKTLAKMTGKSEKELADPKIRQAAEIFAATDAAKSYAFTKIYGVSAKFCSSVKSDLSNYKKKAADIIKLGKYYYTNGINAKIDGKDLSKTGKELTDGLNGMLKKLEEEHKSASQSGLKKKCSDASMALRSLATLYSM